MHRRTPLTPVVFRVLLLLAVVSTFLWSVVPLGAQTAAGATLTVLRGAVAVRKADGTPLSPASSGTIIGEGDQVATLASSSALVTFFDGSEVELGADTAIIVQQMASRGSQTSITLESVFGSTIHRVVTLTDPGSSYRVEAGGSVALVRGTVFGHYRDRTTGDVTVAVLEGEVEFPFPGRIIRKGERRTYTSRGDVQTDRWDTGGSLYVAISEAVSASNPNGSDNPGQNTGSRAIQEQPDRLTEDSGPNRQTANNPAVNNPAVNNPATNTQGATTEGSSTQGSNNPVRTGFYLLVAAPAGSTRLLVSSIDGIHVGDCILLNPGGPNQELVRVLSIGPLGAEQVGPGDQVVLKRSADAAPAGREVVSLLVPGELGVTTTIGDHAAGEAFAPAAGTGGHADADQYGNLDVHADRDDDRDGYGGVDCDVHLDADPDPDRHGDANDHGDADEHGFTDEHGHRHVYLDANLDEHGHRHVYLDADLDVYQYGDANRDADADLDRDRDGDHHHYRHGDVDEHADSNGDRDVHEYADLDRHRDRDCDGDHHYHRHGDVDLDGDRDVHEHADRDPHDGPQTRVRHHQGHKWRRRKRA